MCAKLSVSGLQCHLKQPYGLTDHSVFWKLFSHFTAAEVLPSLLSNTLDVQEREKKPVAGWDWFHAYGSLAANKESSFRENTNESLENKVPCMAPSVFAKGQPRIPEVLPGSSPFCSAKFRKAQQ